MAPQKWTSKWLTLISLLKKVTFGLSSDTVSLTQPAVLSGSGSMATNWQNFASDLSSSSRKVEESNALTGSGDSCVAQVLKKARTWSNHLK